MASKQLSDPYTALPPSTLPKLQIQHPQPISTLKRQADQDDIDTSNDSLKVFLLSELIGIGRPNRMSP